MTIRPSPAVPGLKTWHRQRGKSSERGVALALVLVVGLLLSITVAVMLQAAGFRFSGAEAQRQRESTFYVSEAGVQSVLYKLNQKIPPFDKQDVADWPVNTSKTDTVQLLTDDADPTNDRTVTVTVTRVSANPGPGQFKIQAAATLPGTT